MVVEMQSAQQIFVGRESRFAEGFALAEYEVPAHSTGPAGRASDGDALGLYVLEGLLALTIGGETLTLPAGAVVSTRAGEWLTCWNPAASPAYVQMWYLPAGGKGS